MTDITLYAFPTGPGFFNFSPYCGKADILLQLAGINYETVAPEDHKVFSKGKLPVIKDQDQIIEDSEFIRYHLAEHHSATLDKGLSSESKAIGHAVCRMLDERTIHAIVWTRWVEDAGWQQIRGVFFEGQPDEVAETVRSQVKVAVEAAGFGLHSTEEKQRLIREDIQTLSELLGEQEFFLSNTPTYLDATVFSFIANLYGTPFDTWTKAIVAEFPNLVSYFERGMARWYPNAAVSAAA